MSNGNVIKGNENHKKRFQKLNEKEQKVSVEKIELQRRLDQITAENEKLNGKRENLQKEVKKLAIWWSEFDDENEKLVEENAQK